ncbi:oxidoreductase [Lophiostoma macrostomum CBS 122681]|uniref:Oxidoreductase n=1 Tax=Lophiostoma macrostomum CBS 122681 TaxID=1314788 RepID=A0A6A6TTE8_9PLEO|nr:oxidoreductase [Lophiostoma macrostomum CBS 122681]
MPLQTAYNPAEDISNLNGKVIVITGGTTGLGAQTIRTLAQHRPSQIFFTGRNVSASESVIQAGKAISPTTTFTFIPCDQNSLSSIQTAARLITSKTPNLDILICNAGIMASPPGLTADGYEVQFGINFLAHALWIKLLLPSLERSSTTTSSSSPSSNEPSDPRIILLTSTSFQIAPAAGIIFSDLQTPQENIGFQAKFTRYGQSKLALVLYAKALAKRYERVTTVAVHPGVINTGIITEQPFWAWLWLRLFINLGLLGAELSLEEGAYTTCWAATSPRSKDLVSGGLYEPVGKPIADTKQSGDELLQERLWEWTQAQLEAYT